MRALDARACTAHGGARSARTGDALRGSPSDATHPPPYLPAPASDRSKESDPSRGTRRLAPGNPKTVVYFALDILRCPSVIVPDLSERCLCCYPSRLDWYFPTLGPAGRPEPRAVSHAEKACSPAAGAGAGAGRRMERRAR